MMALLWLTVSAPFVVAAQQEIAKQERMLEAGAPASGCPDEAADDSSGNNSIEEKVPGTTNFSEEFLHDHDITHYLSSETSRYHKLESAGTYTAFHGELLVPPPNVA